MESKKIKENEHQIIPFRFKVSLDLAKETFEKKIQKHIDFQHKQTICSYPIVDKDGQVYLMAISTNNNGDKPSIIDLANALNGNSFKDSDNQDV